MKQCEFIKDTDENGNTSVSVSSKRRRRLDLIPRLICLFVALIIWLWMVNINDTDVTETMILKIEYAGLDMLEKGGMMIYGMDKNEISVTVKGSNRDIKKHDAANYKAVVDVTSIKETGKYTLPLTVKTPDDVNVTVDSAPLNLSLMVDVSHTKNVPFEVYVTPAPDSGLLKYSYESIITDEVKEISITGPKSILDTIGSARFNVNGNFVSSSDEMTFSDFPLSFMDKNLNEVDTGNAVEYTTEDIEVNVKAIAHKNIPLKVNVSGEGSDLIPKLSQDSVDIWGVPSVVRNITDYTIKLKTAEVDKPATYNMTSDSFPKGVFVNESIKITISFEESAEPIK